MGPTILIIGKAKAINLYAVEEITQLSEACDSSLFPGIGIQK